MMFDGLFCNWQMIAVLSMKEILGEGCDCLGGRQGEKQRMIDY